MIQSIRRLGTVVGAGVTLAVGSVGLAGMAYATFYGNTTTYGHIRSDSNCSNAAGGYCSIRFTDTSTVARPQSYSQYLGNFSSHGVPDGTPIIEAIASGKLNNVYVGVIYGGTGAAGALNCH